MQTLEICGYHLADFAADMPEKCRKCSKCLELSAAHQKAMNYKFDKRKYKILERTKFKRPPDKNDIFVGQSIRKERKYSGITQETLAEICGVTYQQIQKYERGQSRISAGMLCKISAALKVPIDCFFPREFGIYKK